MLYLTQGGDWQTVRAGGYSSSDNNEIGPRLVSDCKVGLAETVN